MSYLTEVVTKAQDWRKKVAAFHSEVEDVMAAPGADVRQYVGRELKALEDVRQHAQRLGKALWVLEQTASGRLVGAIPLEDKAEQSPVANPVNKEKK